MYGKTLGGGFLHLDGKMGKPSQWHACRHISHQQGISLWERVRD